MRPSIAWPVLLIGTPISYALGALIGISWLLPVLNTLPAWPLMVVSLRRRQVAAAVRWMWVWAIVLAVSATFAGWCWPEPSGRLFLHAAAYHREMVAFVFTGAGAEGSPRLFLPQHALHAGAFVVLALATGSLLAMPLGAVLVNYMGAYVGTLAASSAHPWRTVVVAWVPWSIIRVASFVVFGVVLAIPMLRRVAGVTVTLSDQRRWIWAAAAGLVMDALLKAILAPGWRHLIEGAVAGSW